jgi:hypothetical protein
MLIARRKAQRFEAGAGASPVLARARAAHLLLPRIRALEHRRDVVTQAEVRVVAPSDYVTADGLFYQVRQALAAVWSRLKIRFSEFSLGVS